MMNKRGISQIVAYVLLISLAVTLAVFVTLWYRSATEEQVEVALTPVVSAAECEQVNINLKTILDSGNCYIRLYNAGTLKVVKLEANVFPIPQAPATNPLVFDIELLPKQWNVEPEVEDFVNDLLLPSGTSKIEIFPIINVDNQLIKCQKNRVFDVDC